MPFGETQAYGTSLGCLSRRLFVAALCVILASACGVSLILWAVEQGAMQLLAGNAGGEERVHLEDCTGMECYEVFSCSGLREVTQHAREPWTALSGEVWFSIGAYGAIYGYRRPLQWAWQYTAILAALTAFIGLLDGIYITNCAEYPTNFIRQCLGWGPFSSISLASQHIIRQMHVYPKDAVSKALAGTDILRWYLFVTLSQIIGLAYLAAQARYLSWVVERGPLGIGLSFGLDRWDATINDEAVKWRLAFDRQRKIDRQTDAAAAKAEAQAFAEDCGYPLPMPTHYGATLESGLQDIGEEYKEVVDAAGKIMHEVVPDIHLDPEWFFGAPLRLNDIYNHRAQQDLAEALEDAAALRTAEAEGKERRIEL